MDLNRTYLSANYFRDASSLLSHLTEAIGSVGHHIAQSEVVGGVPPLGRDVARALTWWLALCGKLRVRNVEDLLWAKFPGVCPYCRLPVHVQRTCRLQKAQNANPDWQALAAIGREPRHQDQRPRGLRNWQEMFATIYPATDDSRQVNNLSKLVEELGELAEAVRVYPVQPGYALAEAADVFAWLMQVANTFEYRYVGDVGENEVNLGALLALEFPGHCRHCGSLQCHCPAIQPATLGRIATSIPTEMAEFSPAALLFPPDEAMEQFGALQTLITVEDDQYSLTQADVRYVVDALESVALTIAEVARSSEAQGGQLARVNELLSGISESSQLTDARLNELAEMLLLLGDDEKSVMLDTALASTINVGSAIVVELLKKIFLPGQ